MSYTLVVCEKPDAARRIAYALGDAKETRTAGVSVFDVTCSGKQYKVCSALGHLYSLVDSTKNRSVYPVLDLEWAPLDYKGRASSMIATITKLSESADGFVHACDYDQEGEVIGHNILQYACGNKYSQAMRAKFSTLTDDEIRESFASLQKPVVGLAEAGRSRHILDFLYGVNLSRALAQSFKACNNGYLNLSIGRVQGPTIAFAVKREQEIRLHVPDPYWVVNADFEKNVQIIQAHYEKPKVETLAETRSIANECTGKDGIISNIDVKKTMLRPPTPFNIGDLQREAYRLFKISPGYTLAISEKLYLQALISYPRTSSQKLPTSINYRKILSELGGTGTYNRSVSILLAKGRLAPNEGSMTDPAHPAIYPTGVIRRLSGLEFKVYDLIVKRFFATFGNAAMTERTQIAINVSGHLFLVEGKRVLYDGWMTLYRPYVNFEESTLPVLQKGDALVNRQVVMEEKFTQSQLRYNQSSLLAKMEQEQIGTKATRADIIATLFKRNYLSSRQGGIEVTDLGFAIVESMMERMPAIVSTELTRSMEEQLEKVAQCMQRPADVIEFAVEKLVEALAAFRDGQMEIGRQLRVQQEEFVFGGCPLCTTGRLYIIHSRTTKKRFVGCSNYASGCRASAPLPQKGRIRVLQKICKKCGWPTMSIIFGRGRQWKSCLNIHCPTKAK